MTDALQTANCPRCGRACPVGPHDSAHCTKCFTSFRADLAQQADRDVEALSFIAGGAALRAEVEHDLEERGLVTTSDEPYANLTEAGRDLLAEAGETVYVCAAGHRFTKRMRRYADCFCPRCGCNDVAWDSEP